MNQSIFISRSGFLLDPATVKQNFFYLLLCAPAQIPALRQALLDGRIDGYQYHGCCRCALGYLYGEEAAPHVAEDEEFAPTEKFFLQIRPGQTPETSDAVRLAVDWIDEFQALLAAAAPPPQPAAVAISDGGQGYYDTLRHCPCCDYPNSPSAGCCQECGHEIETVGGWFEVVESTK